ncbi:MAG: hypothetical protein HY720_14840 [Planctomycetes bacterium]|nr:hypothetical protein [Planctomycetota bacterium]
MNGLAVYRTEDYSFGKPSRITARTSVGAKGVVNVEREARLSRRTHEKGVLILAGYIQGRFGREKPISCTATLCFEQSYSGVDGDSASSTELYALLSNLSGVPLRIRVASARLTLRLLRLHLVLLFAAQRARCQPIPGRSAVERVRQ